MADKSADRVQKSEAQKMKDTDTDNIINLFSHHLFWDTDREKLDMEKDKRYIVKQVLEYGFINDWRLIKSCYGIEKISQTARMFRELDKKTLSFIATISNTSSKDYRCYTEQQLTPRHWNF